MAMRADEWHRALGAVGTRSKIDFLTWFTYYAAVKHPEVRAIALGEVRLSIRRIIGNGNSYHIANHLKLRLSVLCVGLIYPHVSKRDTNYPFGWL